MTDWHSRQTVEAIPHGLRIAAVAWAQQLDWASWKASAQPLPVKHPPMAREVAPTTLTSDGEPTQTHGKRPVAGRDAQAVWRQALLAEMRRRNSAIRTEQAYEHWVDRFLTFWGHAKPCEVGVAEVLAFLHPWR